MLIIPSVNTHEQRDAALNGITEARLRCLETGLRRQQLNSRTYSKIEIDFSGGDQI